jgi:hypothetical protein
MLGVARVGHPCRAYGGSASTAVKFAAPIVQFASLLGDCFRALDRRKLAAAVVCGLGFPLAQHLLWGRS